MSPPPARSRDEPMLVALAVALIITGMSTYVAIGFNLVAMLFEHATGASFPDVVWDVLHFAAAGWGVTHYILTIAFLFSLPAGITEAGPTKNHPNRMVF